MKMTKTEAIKELELIKACIEWEYSLEYQIAFDMAIKALEHEQERREDIYECPNCMGEVHINYIYCPFCGIKMENNE